jgi:hypothetical protein
MTLRWLLITGFVLLEAHAVAAAQRPAAGARSGVLDAFLGKIDGGCWIGSGYQHLKKELARRIPITSSTVDIKGLVPARVHEMIGNPNVVDRGEYTEFAFSLRNGSYRGIRAITLTVAVGNENGINVQAIKLEGERSAINAAVSAEVISARRAFQKQPDHALARADIVHSDGRSRLSCDQST